MAPLSESARDRVRRVIDFLVSMAAAQLVVVGLSALSGLPWPLLPVQLLWLNVVTGGIHGVALALQTGEPDALRRKPRPPTERIFDPLLIERTIVGAAVIGGVAFAAFHWMLATGWTEYEARNALLLLLVLFQNVHIANCRSEISSAFRRSPLASPVLLAGAITAFFVHVAAMHLPVGSAILGARPLDPPTWLLLIGLALTALPAIELHKWTWRRRHRSR